MNGKTSYEKHKSKVFFRFIVNLLHFLTQPSPSIHYSEDRRRALLLSSLLVFVIPLFYIPQFIRGLTATNIELLYRSTIIFLFLLCSYGLSRTRQYMIGAVITVFLFALIPFWGLAAVGDYSQKGLITALIWIVLPVLLGILLLSLRFLLILVSAILAAVLLLPFLIQQITFSSIIYPLGYTSTISLLILIAAIIRNSDLKHIEQQTRKLSESEEMYKSIAENTNDVIMLTLPNGIISYLSPACKKVLGHDPEDLVGRQPWIIHPDDLEKVKTIHHQALHGESVSNFEYRIITKADEIKYVSHSCSNVRKDNQIQILVSIIRDISEFKKMEDELLKAHKLESIGILAGGIAHDFNNIITAIWGHISLAKINMNPEEEIYDLLAGAEKASMQAKDLTQQLLTFAKGGAPVRKTASIERLIEDTAGFALRGSNVRCKFSIPDNLWSVEVDEGQISQVINNLIINAQHSIPGGGIIGVQAENTISGEECALPLEEGKYVKISIKDQGTGISKENLPKIFDPYFTTKQNGSGLGLATSYSIVKNHDGYITVESELGVGTTFYIYLPASPKEILTKGKVEEKLLVGKGKILVMDDEELIRKVIGKMLRSIGYDAAFVKDGTEAIELYKNEKDTGMPFDAVIMDLTIPAGMGGKEAIKKLLEIDHEAKVIVSSGYSNDPIMADYRKYGFSGVVVKPYALKALSEALYNII